jgi:cell division protein FtsL
MLRLLNIVMVAALIGSASWVYSIKYESTKYAERINKMRAEIRKEKDTIAKLRAEWASANRPQRLQQIADRHLQYKPLTVEQYDSLSGLPDRPPVVVPAPDDDPIARLLDASAARDFYTGSVKPPR